MSIGSLSERFLPGAYNLAHYQRRNLRGDLVGGITVTAYLIPQVMAYAVIAGLPPVTGLWAILPSMACYAIFGSSRQLSVGPESTTALMTAVVIGPLAAGDPARYAALAASFAAIIGLFSLVCWAARLGGLAQLLSRPVLVGYMSGIAILMIVSQLDKLTGVTSSGDSFVAAVTDFVANISEIQLGTAVLGAAVLIGVIALSLVWRKGPGPLIAVVLATAVVAIFGLDADGIAVVGEIPSGLPVPSLPSLSDFGQLAVPALGVLLVGYTDNVLTARSFATKRAYRIDDNQELFALGISNIAASLFRGFPVSSSASRTAIADTAGARTQLYSLVAVAGTICILLFLGPLLAKFPTAALGAIVVFAALKLISISDYRRLAKFRISEFLLAIAALVSVLLFGILYGILIAIALSVAEMMVRVARPHAAVLGFVPDLAGMHDVEDFDSVRTVPGLVVYRYDSPLFFANAEDFRTRALAAVEEAEGNVVWFLLNAEANVEVDITALDALGDLRQQLQHRGVRLCLARVKQELRDQLDAYGLSDEIGTDYMFPTLPTAVEAFRKRSEPT